MLDEPVSEVAITKSEDATEDDINLHVVIQPTVDLDGEKPVHPEDARQETVP